MRVLRRAPVPGGTHADAVHAAGEITGDLLSTLDHNLSAKPHEQLPIRTLAVRVSGRSLSSFRAQLARRAEGLLETTDAFLQAHRSECPLKVTGAQDGLAVQADPSARVDSESLILGAGIFAICRTPTPQELETVPRSSTAKRQQTRKRSR